MPFFDRAATYAMGLLIVGFLRPNGLGSAAGRLRREHLRNKTNQNARGNVEIAQDSPVGCNPG